MGQIPLVVVTKYLYRKYPGSSIGNILFWVSFCVVGQPMAILLYTIDFKYGKMQHSVPEIFDATDMCKLMLFGKCLLEDKTADSFDMAEKACKIMFFDKCFLR
jgi:hypothetical protein